MSMNRLAFAERRSAGRTLPRFAALAGLLCFSFHAQSVRAATEWYDGITAAVDKSLTPEGRGAPRPVKFRFELREKDLTFTAPDGKFTVPLDGKPVPSAATAYCNGKPTNLRRSWSANAFFYVEPGRPWGTPLTRLAFQRSSDLSFPTGSPCAGKDSLVETIYVSLANKSCNFDYTLVHASAKRSVWDASFSADKRPCEATFPADAPSPSAAPAPSGPQIAASDPQPPAGAKPQDRTLRVLAVCQPLAKANESLREPLLQLDAELIELMIFNASSTPRPRASRKPAGTSMAT